MLEFLMLLQKKLPPGFEISFRKTPLGMIVTFRFGGIKSECCITDYMIEDDTMHEGAKSQFNEMVFEDQIKKIKNHTSYTKQQVLP